MAAARWAQSASAIDGHSTSRPPTRGAQARASAGVSTRGWLLRQAQPSSWLCSAAGAAPSSALPRHAAATASCPSPAPPPGLQLPLARDRHGRLNRAPNLPPCRSAAPSNPGPSSNPGPIPATGTAAAATSNGVGTAFGDPNTLMGVLMAYAVQLQQQQQQQQAGGEGGAARTPGAEVRLEGVGFHPPGAERPLLSGVSLALPANILGLVIGRSGSGKTTLLQVLAGLTEQTEGRIRISRGGAGGGGGSTASSSSDAGGGGVGGGGSGIRGNGVSSAGAPAPAAAAAGPGLTMEERMQQVGLVFQFPERHFLGEDLMQELTFTWPRLPQYWGERQLLSVRLQQALEAVGLEDVPLHVRPWALSGGQQRRLALALQLVRQPGLLLLDEPLAGLDWVARQEVVAILRRLKDQCTLLVVSHDLGEIAPLVDVAWRMRVGGTCEPVAWPPPDLAGLEQ